MHATLTGLGRIHQIAMRIHDIDRAVTFYRDALGLPFLFAAPPSLAFFDCGGVRLMLSPPSPGHDHPGSVLYFAVDDIQAMHRDAGRARRRLQRGAEEDRDAARPRGVAGAVRRHRGQHAGADVGAAPRRGLAFQQRASLGLERLDIALPGVALASSTATATCRSGPRERCGS